LGGARRGLNEPRGHGGDGVRKLGGGGGGPEPYRQKKLRNFRVPGQGGISRVGHSGKGNEGVFPVPSKLDKVSVPVRCNF